MWQSIKVLFTYKPIYHLVTITNSSATTWSQIKFSLSASSLIIIHQIFRNQYFFCKLVNNCLYFSFTSRVNFHAANQPMRNNQCTQCHFHSNSSLFACEVPERKHCSPLHHHSPTVRNMLSLAPLRVSITIFFVSIILVTLIANLLPNSYKKIIFLKCKTFNRVY